MFAGKCYASSVEIKEIEREADVQRESDVREAVKRQSPYCEANLLRTVIIYKT
jgi:hypothetical protein